MKEGRLGLAAGFLFATLLATDSMIPAPKNPEDTQLSFPCATGEIGSHQNGFSEPYLMLNELPEGKLIVIDPWAKKQYSFQKQETNKHIIIDKRPALELIFEKDSTIKYTVSCIFDGSSA